MKNFRKSQGELASRHKGVASAEHLIWITGMSDARPFPEAPDLRNTIYISLLHGLSIETRGLVRSLCNAART